MTIDITASSRTGCVRTNNEDMLLIGELLLRNGKMSSRVATSGSDRYLLALADGMGGHSCGEVASADTLSNLRFFFNDMPAGLKPGGFEEAICGWLKSINNIACRDMGTTLVALAYYGGLFFWMNCGDSRLYRLHDGGLTQLTKDHSLNNLMGVAKHSNLITNCIGGGCKTSYIDIVECTDQVMPGDTMMICSDGLTDMISDDEIRGILSDGFDADALCQAAEDAGGRDNISVIVARMSE